MSNVRDKWYTVAVPCEYQQEENISHVSCVEVDVGRIQPQFMFLTKNLLNAACHVDMFAEESFKGERGGKRVCQHAVAILPMSLFR